MKLAGAREIGLKLTSPLTMAGAARALPRFRAKLQAQPWRYELTIREIYVKLEYREGGSCMGAKYSDFTGDRLAISEFNAAHSMRKISPAYGLNLTVPSSEEWAGRMFLAHIFDHSLYGSGQRAN
jgi:hypothetical protein